MILDLNEQQCAVIGALTNGNCCLKLEPDGNYQLYHEDQAIGYSLSAAEVTEMTAAGLVAKVEAFILTPVGKAWATRNLAL